MTSRKIDTSSRILKILKLLIDKPRSMNELCRELNWEVYPETISKYLATLREYSFVIEKRRHRFELKSMPFFINFNEDELNILSKFEGMASKINSKTCYLKIKSSLNKIFRFSSSENREKYDKILKTVKDINIYDKYKEKIEKLSIYIDDTSQRIKFKYKNSNYTVSPLNFKYKSDKIYLFGFDEENLVYKEFLLDDISEIENYPQPSSKMPFAKKTIFRLSGRVAKGYKSPYAFEEIQYENDGTILVFNYYEDKDVLMKRLLKYFNYCEIVSPKSRREEFLKLVNRMIKNYS